jgi:vacuolar-type H+-ATPase subunit H
MKSILDSIIKVEQDLQKKNIQATNEAKTIIADSKEKVEKMEGQFADGFEQEHQDRLKEIQSEAKQYEDDLLQKTRKSMADKIAKIDAKSNDIKNKIIGMVLDK